MSAISAPPSAITVTHSSIEPSWLPQVPAILKISGFMACELAATSFTDRSVIAKAHTNMANENATSPPWSTATGRVSASISSPSPPCARTASVPVANCSAASAAASQSAARPNSAII